MWHDIISIHWGDGFNIAVCGWVEIWCLIFYANKTLNLKVTLAILFINENGFLIHIKVIDNGLLEI